LSLQFISIETRSVVIKDGDQGYLYELKRVLTLPRFSEFPSCLHATFAASRSHRDGRNIDILGNYNPTPDKEGVKKVLRVCVRVQINFSIMFISTSQCYYFYNFYSFDATNTSGSFCNSVEANCNAIAAFHASTTGFARSHNNNGTGKIRLRCGGGW
jgi:hypothetical protein